MTLRIVIAVAFVLTGCASRAPRVTGTIQVAPAPDLSGVLRVVGLRGIAHACPVAPDKALTNVHVVGEYYDSRPFIWSTDTADGLLGNVPVGLFWATNRTTEGDAFRDLARVAPFRSTFPRWYPIATAAPIPGETVWFVGYDWRRKNDAFARRVFKSKVLRAVSGHLIYAPAGTPGSSGSCVLNAAGQVVAINAAGMGTDDKGEVGIGVGVWGSLLGLGR
jgi:hypothetical protein